MKLSLKDFQVQLRIASDPLEREIESLKKAPLTDRLAWLREVFYGNQFDIEHLGLIEEYWTRRDYWKLDPILLRYIDDHFVPTWVPDDEHYDLLGKRSLSKWKGYTSAITFQTLTWLDERHFDNYEEETGYEVEEEKAGVLEDIIYGSYSWTEGDESSRGLYFPSEEENDPYEPTVSTTYTLHLTRGDGKPFNQKEKTVLSKRLYVRI